MESLGETDHGEDGYTGEGIAQKQTQRASLVEGFPNPQEKPCANGTPQCDKLDVARF